MVRADTNQGKGGANEYCCICWRFCWRFRLVV